MEFIRFLTVTVIGVSLDISISWILTTIIDIPLLGASTCGFLTASITNYYLHEFWTFQSKTYNSSSLRIIKYLFLQILTLASRLVAILYLENIFYDKNNQLFILIMAAGISFSVNYIISKFFLFKKSS